MLKSIKVLLEEFMSNTIIFCFNSYEDFKGGEIAVDFSPHEPPVTQVLTGLGFLLSDTILGCGHLPDFHDIFELVEADREKNKITLNLKKHPKEIFNL